MITPRPGPRFLVLCPQPIVAEDLLEIIRERLGPDAAEICLDPAMAAARIDGLGAMPVVFAALRTQTIQTLGLDGAVSSRGGRLVIVGGSLSSEEAGARGWLLLPEPFSSEMVEALLADLAPTAFL